MLVLKVAVKKTNIGGLVKPAVNSILLDPEKESLLSASAGALSKEIHWFGPGILSRFGTANPPMTKAPTAAAAVASGDGQRVGCGEA